LEETPWGVINGYIELPTAPGLGLVLNEAEVQKQHTYTEELGGEWFHDADGSVADW
jgi:hypothetical protein